MKKSFFLFLAIVLCISVSAQNGVSLRMKLEKNKVYRFKSSSDQTITQTVNGNQQNIDSKNRSDLSMKIVDATAAFMIAEIRFDTLITNTNTMGKTIQMSSADEGNIKSAETSDIMSCIMNRMSKNALYIKMDYTGKVLEVVNAKMFSDAILKDTSALTVSGVTRSALKKQMLNMAASNSLITMIEVFTHCLPGKDVTQGNNWEIPVQTNSGGMSLEILNSYHLDGISGNSANITSESTIQAAANGEPMEAGPGKITYDDLKGLGKSTIILDVSTGLISELKAKTHLSGNLAFSMPGMNMQIPMEINGESKIISLK